MATTDTCPTCGNAHSGECTPAALKVRIGALEKESGLRMRGIESLRGTLEHNLKRADAIEEERDALRAELAGLRAYLTRSIANDLGGMDEAGDILNNLSAQDRAMVDAWTREMSDPTYWSKEVADLRAQLAEAKATIARLNRLAH